MTAENTATFFSAVGIDAKIIQVAEPKKSQSSFWLGSHGWHIRRLTEYSTWLNLPWLDQRKGEKEKKKKNS